MSARLDMTGSRFDRLLVVAPAETRNGRLFWLCRCDCGTEMTVAGPSLRRGYNKSCGCLRSERMRQAKTVHGHYDSRTYHSYRSMIQRCSDPKIECWPNYGGRGITYCDRWVTFEQFLADMGERPQGTTLDRIDVNGNYEPGNCRWATPKQQRANRRDSK